MEHPEKSCRLCGSSVGLVPLTDRGKRLHIFCPTCHLISTEKRFLPDTEKEKSRYAMHQNDLRDEGYVRFLRQAIDPSLPFLRPEMTGLDYGCGPTPTLSSLLNAAGYACEDYDPFFAPHALEKKFDYIFSTEVFEHFFHPAREIEKIRSLLNHGGLLIVMTERWNELAQFPKWHYTNDVSHVAFYHKKTFDFICDMFGFEKVFDDGLRVQIFKMAVKCVN